MDTKLRAVVSAYDTDLHQWALDQAALLRAGRLEVADIENIAEEIESLARGEKCILVDLLSDLLVQLLRWEFQPAWRSKTWEARILGQREKLTSHLNESPSLKATLDESMKRAYLRAVAKAVRATGFEGDSFPEACPYSFEEILGTTS